MRNTFAAICMGILAFSFIFAGCSLEERPPVNAAESVESADLSPYTIEVGGSTSVTPLMEMFAEDYAKVKSHIKININPTGSGDGVKNAGVLYQIGMSSRELTPAEQGMGFREDVVAIDGIAVIVNSANPVTNLSFDQIRDIYTGRVTDWSQVSEGAKSGRIAVVSREAGSGTRGAFEELVNFTDLVAGANESTSTGAIKSGIAQNADAIGYISLGSLDSSIKALSVEGVAANNDNVINKSYKLARPFILLSKSDAHTESKALLDWMLSPAGQNIVKTSWIPVK